MMLLPDVNFNNGHVFKAHPCCAASVQYQDQCATSCHFQALYCLFLVLTVPLRLLHGVQTTLRLTHSLFISRWRLVLVSIVLQIQLWIFSSVRLKSCIQHRWTHFCLTDYVDINSHAHDTLLLLHGWPSLWASWKYQIQEFKVTRLIGVSVSSHLHHAFVG
jgi:hypothetical protein